MLPRVEAPQAAALIAAQSSLVFDYVEPQKVGGIHMNLFVWKQLPVPTPTISNPTWASSCPASWSSSTPPTT